MVTKSSTNLHALFRPPSASATATIKRNTRRYVPLKSSLHTVPEIQVASKWTCIELDHVFGIQLFQPKTLGMRWILHLDMVAVGTAKQQILLLRLHPATTIPKYVIIKPFVKDFGVHDKFSVASEYNITAFCIKKSKTGIFQCFEKLINDMPEAF